jgi:hypothetical protein
MYWSLLLCLLQEDRSEQVGGPGAHESEQVEAKRRKRTDYGRIFSLIEMAAK